MKNILICAMAMAFAAPAAGFAATGSDDATTAVQVRYHDLNLSNSHDAAIMLKRLDTAALEVCGASSFSLPDYRDAVRRSSCYEKATSRAVASIAAPTVSALYQNRAVAIATTGD